MIPSAALLLVLSLAPVTIRSAIENLQQHASLTIAGERICAEHPLPLFYSRRGYEPAWIRDGRLSPEAAQMIGAIDRASEHGLPPADYHNDAIHALLPERASRAGELDMLFTDAFFLLASHLLSGRVDPESMEPTWCLQPRSFDLLAALETALENGDVRATIDRMAPAHPEYRRLRGELARLRVIDSRGGWGSIDPGPRLAKGDSGARVDQLVERLAAGGHLSGTHASFDQDADDALRRFQRAHGLTDDGIAGPATLRKLNVAVAQRVRRVELNLERWRWLPASLGDRYLLINIPEFGLRLVDEGRQILSMRIVVGQAMKRTPVFSTSMTQVIFNPSWNVPDSIAGEELWPNQQRDSTFFAREHIEVLPNGKLRQTPGPWNALGRLKFNMPNRYNVYLHDTPARTLFQQSVRTFSHGCIRIEKPIDLAAYLLRGEPEWTGERIVAETTTNHECAADLDRPVAVHILYWTAFIGEGGELHFAPDVYDRDGALDRAMRKPPERF